ncbi:hypothetical protein [Gloeothece verrucosa]|uniref:Uncharacterized protein n=1 Tax=Gloeothece verrucosa (strain PCC 7822) TaxID=497965 RepID=E0UFJ9_GLOV7|nr:hypothetical protein [Gloeothece verrucosa]ADN16693.1 hypothetical protein Cyan7822_4799 [Gloeothece verrucosa PCC 7822]
MKEKSIIKSACSLVLVFLLALSIIVIAPGVASAQNAPDDPIAILNQAQAFKSEGNTVTAQALYQQAIEEVKLKQHIHVLIIAKTELAEILEQQGKTAEAEKLREEAEAAIIALAIKPKTAGICGECTTPTRKPGERSGGLCVQCGP